MSKYPCSYTAISMHTYNLNYYAMCTCMRIVCITLDTYSTSYLYSCAPAGILQAPQRNTICIMDPHLRQGQLEWALIASMLGAIVHLTAGEDTMDNLISSWLKHDHC